MVWAFCCLFLASWGFGVPSGFLLPSSTAFGFINPKEWVLCAAWSCYVRWVEWHSGVGADLLMVLVSLGLLVLYWPYHSHLALKLIWSVVDAEFLGFFAAIFSAVIGHLCYLELSC
ncbi:hypothetical protein U1Q18_011409 [Sarracenia purpurea var. burkii]